MSNLDEDKHLTVKSDMMNACVYPQMSYRRPRGSLISYQFQSEGVQCAGCAPTHTHTHTYIRRHRRAWRGGLMKLSGTTDKLGRVDPVANLQSGWTMRRCPKEITHQHHGNVVIKPFTASNCPRWSCWWVIGRWLADRRMITAPASRLITLARP